MNLPIDAHSQVARAIRRGELVRQPCDICGKQPAHAHHDTYEEPLVVRWLCASHHRGLHVILDRLNARSIRQRKSPLRTFRRVRVMTQAQLAKLAGVSQTVICHAEQGRVQLPPHVQARVAAILGSTPEQLFPEPEVTR